MNRRSALSLLAVVGLTGCSLQPIEWAEPTAEPVSTADPAVEVRSDFHIQTRDSGVKTLEQGQTVGLRISTPHFDGVLEQLYLGERLSEQDAAQLRQRTAIRAPQRHEFLVFTMRAGIPSFLSDDEDAVTFQVRVGEAAHPIGAPFGRFIASETAEYEVPWMMLALCIPVGEEVFLDVTDQERTVSVNLVQGEPVDDETWAATAGFRERHLISVGPDRGSFAQGVTSLPSGDQEVDQATFTMTLTANPGASVLAPWLPAHGWAVAGMQWLQLRFAIEPQFDNSLFRYDLSGPETFKYERVGEAAQPAVSPERVTTEGVETSRRLDVVFQVPSGDPAGTLLCRPAGTLQALYRGVGAVPAQFVGEASALSFAVSLSPDPAQ